MCYLRIRILRPAYIGIAKAAAVSLAARRLQHSFLGSAFWYPVSHLLTKFLGYFSNNANVSTYVRIKSFERH